MRSRLNIALHGFLVLWIAAISVAPLWHGDHDAPALPDPSAAHSHGTGAYLCGPRPEAFKPDTTCVLCAAKRLLSQHSLHAPAGIVEPTELRGTPSTSPAIPIAGLALPGASRAPPLG